MLRLLRVIISRDDNPCRKTVWVYRASGQVTHLGVEDTLSGEEVFPDFTCQVAEVFPGQHTSPGE